MSEARPKTVEEKGQNYQRQNRGRPLTVRQRRQLRRTEPHLVASMKKRRKLAARRAAETKRRNREEQEIADKMGISLKQLRERMRS